MKQGKTTKPGPAILHGLYSRGLYCFQPGVSPPLLRGGAAWCLIISQNSVIADGSAIGSRYRSTPSKFPLWGFWSACNDTLAVSARFFVVSGSRNRFTAGLPRCVFALSATPGVTAPVISRLFTCQGTGKRAGLPTPFTIPPEKNAKCPYFFENFF